MTENQANQASLIFIGTGPYAKAKERGVKLIYAYKHTKIQLALSF